MTRRTLFHSGLVSAAFLILGCAPMPSVGVVYVERRPPPERVEVIRVAPRPGVVWVAGYWSWGGADYLWVPGRWVPADRGYHRWSRGRWHHSRRGWYRSEGHWE